MPYDFAQIDFVNQFITAVHDRTLMVNPPAFGSPTLKSVGDDVQSAAFWAGLQNSLQTSVTYYLNNTFADRTPCETTLDFGEGDVTNGPHVAGNWTLAAWRAAAGINAAGFRRMTSTNATAYGTMQAGDVIGDWIFDELAAGLRLLNKSAWSSYDQGKRVGSGTGKSPSAYDGGGNSVDDNPGSYTQARGRRDANYTTNLFLPGGSLGSTFYAITSTSNTNYQPFAFANPPTQYGAGASVAIPVNRATSLPTTMSKSVEFWVACVSYYVTDPPQDAHQFDDNGYNVSDGCWCIFETVDAGMAATATMSDPGGAIPHEASDAPVDNVEFFPGSYNSDRGFRLNLSSTGNGTIIIVRWNFTDPPV